MVNRWTVAFGVVMAHLVGSVAVPACRHGGNALLPAAEGRITELGIQFHRLSADTFLPVFGQILAGLDEDVAVRVTVADDSDRELFEAARAEWFPDGGGPRIDYAQTGRPITSWHRDRLVVRVDGTVVAPPRPMTGPEPRVYDWTVPWTVADHLRRPLRVTDYRFDGGDLITDGEHTFVATPLFRRNPDRSPEDLIARLEADFWRPVVWIGRTGEVPDHHIGMFLTPLGGRRVVVGDPDLALSRLGHPESLGGYPISADLEPFRRVADELEEAGFEVIPMPLLPTAEKWTWFSYNNVLLDEREDGLHVFLPVYDVPLDALAIDTWEGLGATVHPIEVRGVFGLGGSVRCLTAPLSRGPARP